MSVIKSTLCEVLLIFYCIVCECGFVCFFFFYMKKTCIRVKIPEIIFNFCLKCLFFILIVLREALTTYP